MTQRNKYRSPWARQFFGRKQGETHRQYEDRWVRNTCLAFCVLGIIAGVVIPSWWQHRKYKEPPQREMNGAVRHSAGMIVQGLAKGGGNQ